MLFNTLLKKPMLAIGILMFGIVLFQASQKGGWGIFTNAKLNPTSCSAVLAKLQKSLPGNWRAFCEKNNLAVEIKELTEVKGIDLIRPVMYRQLANHMMFTVQHSPIDILERVDIVRFKMDHEKLEINAVTTGNYIAKLQTIKDQKYILDHLKSTVRVKETVK